MLGQVIYYGMLAGRGSIRKRRRGPNHCRHSDCPPTASDRRPRHDRFGRLHRRRGGYAFRKASDTETGQQDRLWRLRRLDFGLVLVDEVRSLRRGRFFQGFDNQILRPRDRGCGHGPRQACRAIACSIGICSSKITTTPPADQARAAADVPPRPGRPSDRDWLSWPSDYQQALRSRQCGHAYCQSGVPSRAR